MNLELPWVEKYRPSSLSEVVGQKHIVNRLKSYVEKRNVPNQLYAGPAGVGKTTCAIALAKELYGKQFEQNFLELNASDDRGIDVVRNTIKDFARTLAFDANFKIIFLDECDSMTSDAQQALRRTMEKYTKTCRFILSCVTPDTKIILPEEREITIKDFMQMFEERKESMLFNINEKEMNGKCDQVLACIQMNPKKMKKQLFELTTMSGRKLKVTEDHPILTETGWKKVSELNINDKLVVFPNLESTQLEKNSKKIFELNEFVDFLLNKENECWYKHIAKAKNSKELTTQDKNKTVARTKKPNKTVKNCLAGKKTNRIDLINKTLSILQEKGLLEIRYDSKKIGALTRIFAFIYGDGYITKKQKTIIFSGNKKTLEAIEKDLTVLGFKGMKIQTKEIKNYLKDKYLTRKRFSLIVNSNPFAELLIFLGAPSGDKTVKAYKIPQWIMNGTRFVKREFLRSLYGSKGCFPKIKNKNFEALTLRAYKSRELKQNMIEYFEQIKSLLKEFDVDSYIKITSSEYERKDGQISDCYSLILNSTNENLFKFFSRIGYAYEREKNIKARIASEYLRHKLFYLVQQREKAQEILLEYNENISAGSVNFVINQLKDKKVGLAISFPSFSEWKKKYYFKNELVFNELKEIKEISANDVRDLQCFKDHNFIANGIVSHNCNYSSKIIEPIQSRCVVFRFRPLEENELKGKIIEIAKKEGIKLDEKALNAIEYVSAGDMRKAINVLQGSAMLGKKITEEMIFNVSSRAKPKEIREMIELAMKKKFLEARKMLQELMFSHGMSGEDIILQLYQETINLKELSEKEKVELIDKIGEYNFRMVEGANEHIQLEALLAQYMKYSK